MRTRSSAPSSRRFALVTALAAGMLLVPLLAAAYTIDGTITDSQTGEPIVGAQVVLLELDLIGQTGSDGSYVIDDVPAGSYTIRIYATGYEEAGFAVRLSEDQGLSATLAGVVVDMEPIEVTADAPGIDPKEVVGQTRIAALPTRQDPFELIRQEPGVSSMLETLPSWNAAFPEEMPGYVIYGERAQYGYSIYGGEPDWNQYWFGSIPLPYYRHVIGESRAIFPDEAVSRISIAQGAAPLELGQGIGGTVEVQTADDLASLDPLLRLQGSTGLASALYRGPLIGRIGLLASVRHTTYDLDRGIYGDIWQPDRVYLPPVTEDLKPKNPRRSGDALVELTANEGDHYFSTDLLGLYGSTKSASGTSYVPDEEGNPTREAGGAPEDLTETHHLFGGIGLRWDYLGARWESQLRASLSSFQAGTTTQAWDDIEQAFLPYQDYVIGSTNAYVAEEISYHPGARSTLSLGGRVEWSRANGTYERGEVWNLLESYLADHPRIHWTLEELLSPEGEVVLFGEEYSFETAFSALRPYAYGSYAYQDQDFSAQVGIGLSVPIRDGLSGLLPAAEAGLGYTAGKLRLGLRTGWSPGAIDLQKYVERAVTEDYFGLTSSTATADPPYGLVLDPTAVYRFDESWSLGLKPWLAWYYGLSGFSMQTNYRTSLRIYHREDLELLEPRQALCWGATVQAEREVERGLSFGTSYTLAWNRYQLDDGTWVWANTDVRHTLKNSLVFTHSPRDLTLRRMGVTVGLTDLSIGAVFDVSVDRPFTPVTLVQTDVGLEGQTEAYNSARDFYPYFTLQLRAEAGIRFLGGDLTFFADARHLLEFANRELYGLNESATTAGASTREWRYRNYRQTTMLSTSLCWMELGIRITY